MGRRLRRNAFGSAWRLRQDGPTAIAITAVMYERGCMLPGRRPNEEGCGFDAKPSGSRGGGGMIGCQPIMQGLRPPFFCGIGVPPSKVAGYCTAFARRSPCVIRCNSSQGLRF